MMTQFYKTFMSREREFLQRVVRIFARLTILETKKISSIGNHKKIGGSMLSEWLVHGCFNYV